jgi:hypothetical protein
MFLFMGIHLAGMVLSLFDQQPVMQKASVALLVIGGGGFYASVVEYMLWGRGSDSGCCRSAWSRFRHIRGLTKICGSRKEKTQLLGLLLLLLLHLFLAWRVWLYYLVSFLLLLHSLLMV